MQYLYAAFAIVLGLTAFWAARRTHRLRQQVLSWPTVRGQVTSREVIQPTNRGSLSSPGFRFAPDVRYTYTVDGVEHEGDKTTLPWSGTGSRKSAQKVLDRIPDETDVRYDPADPSKSCLFAPTRGSIVGWSVAGVVVILLAAVYAAS